MNGSWRRLGTLSLDASAAPWASSHAALPVLEPVSESTWNVYLSCRDVEGRARIGRTRLVMTGRPALEPLVPDPVLDLGPLGAFDDSGVTSSSLVAAGGRGYLYYTGWMRGVTVPFYLAAGVAVSDDGRTFRRLSCAPLLERTPGDPFLTASPFVLRERENRWRMWYVSGSRWEAAPSGARHYYHIRYAESDDGLTWRRPGMVCIDYAAPDEHAFARPCVVKDADTFRMWYSVRGERYRIGYAESSDGTRWQRDDARAGLTAAGDGWESEMVEYPWVFDWQDARYMLYNGNDYGRSGVGLAVWEPASTK